MRSTFASRIKELRLSLHATQTDFAEKIGTTQTALSSYEQGDRIPSAEMLINISDNFNVSIDWLLGLSNIKGIDNKPETMGDILQILFTIGSYCDIQILQHSIERQDINLTTGYPEFYQTDIPVIGFKNNLLNDFLSEWDKMYTLYKNGTIDDEVYYLWIEKTVNKANAYTPTGEKYYTSIPDDLIPL